MASGPNNGAFYIRAEDVNSTDSFKVPGDRTGYSPDGTKNPAQESYHIANRQTKYRKFYNISIFNGWDTDIKIKLRGSSFDDRSMTKSSIEQPRTTLGSGSPITLEDMTGHNFMEVEITDVLSIPSTGTLEIVIQDRL